MSQSLPTLNGSNFVEIIQECESKLAEFVKKNDGVVNESIVANFIFSYLHNSYFKEMKFPKIIGTEISREAQNPCEHCDNTRFIHDLVLLDKNQGKYLYDLVLEIKVYHNHPLYESHEKKIECDIQHVSDTNNGVCLIVNVGGVKMQIDQLEKIQDTANSKSVTLVVFNI